MKGMLRRTAQNLQHMSLRSQMLLLIPIMGALLLVNWSVFFFTLRYQVEENAEKNMQDIAERTEYYIDANISSVVNQFTALESAPSLYNLKNGLYGRTEQTGTSSASAYLDLDILLRSALASNQNSLESIYINFNDGALMVQKFNNYAMNVNFLYDDWKARYADSRLYISDIEQMEEISASQISCVIFRLYESKNDDISGIVLFGLKRSFFSDILSELKMYDGSRFYIVTQAGEVLDLAETGQDRATLPDGVRGRIAQAEQDFFALTEDGQYVCAKPISSTGWKLVLQVPEASVMKNVRDLSLRYLVASTLIILVMALLVSFIAELMTKPLRRLTEAVVEMKNTELRADFESSGCREITILGEEMRRMQDYSIALMEGIRTERDLKRRAELNALQEQIKPHFLYNTLYSIQQLCDSGQNEMASHMLQELASFYHLGLSGGSPVVSIKVELLHAENYLQLQKMRYGDRFDYIIDCDTSILDRTVPRLILQPLIENAIYHGVKLMDQPGFISIIGGMDGSDIYLEVHDNGPGISQQEIRKINRELCEAAGTLETQAPADEYAHGLGLKNVNFRIRNSYGEGSGVQLSSEPMIDTYARVTIQDSFALRM